jgi:glycosyltransferase involved in cell wall biosynthesis
VPADVANMDDMVQKAVYLLESPEEAANMGERGKAAYRQEYNWENEEEKLLSLFDELNSCS